MIVVLAAAAGGALLLGGITLWSRSRAQQRVKARPSPAADTSSSAPASANAPRLGDVVMVGGHELHLTGEWTLAEAGEPLLTLFFAGERCLALPAAGDAALAVLEPAHVPGLRGELPGSLELAGERYERRGRRPARVTARGAAPEPPTETPLCAEYEHPTRALWLIGRAGSWVCFCGEKFARSTLDVWGPGSAAPSD